MLSSRNPSSSLVSPLPFTTFKRPVAGFGSGTATQSGGIVKLILTRWLEVPIIVAPPVRVAEYSLPGTGGFGWIVTVGADATTTASNVIPGAMLNVCIVALAATKTSAATASGASIRSARRT